MSMWSILRRKLATQPSSSSALVCSKFSFLILFFFFTQISKLFFKFVVRLILFIYRFLDAQPQRVAIPLPK